MDAFLQRRTSLVSSSVPSSLQIALLAPPPPLNRSRNPAQRWSCNSAERPVCRSSSAFFVAAVATGATEQSNEQQKEEEEEEDLKQIKDRDNWYVSRFIADDAPDWNSGKFVRSEDVAPGLRVVVLEAEVSREKVPLRNAYKHVGQKASVRVNNGPPREVTVSSSPFPELLNQDALFKARGDISAGEIKIFKDVLTVSAEVHVLLTEKEAEEIFNLSDDDRVEIGPFVGTGVNLRPMQSIFQFPTLVIFAEGKGIATAKTLIEAAGDANGLDFGFRQDVRLYYRAPNQDALCFKNLYEDWEQKHACKVITGTRETFMELFDDDNTLTYEPSTTAALIFTGADEEAEKAALEVCKEAEIEVKITDSGEQAATVYLAQVNKGQV